MLAHLDEFIQAAADHLFILGVSLGIAILICIPIRPNWDWYVEVVFSVTSLLV